MAKQVTFEDRKNLTKVTAERMLVGPVNAGPATSANVVPTATRSYGVVVVRTADGTRITA